ncbi:MULTISPECIES: hypothetical protein [Bradyrhizobium]|uniref:hypothetical protein n=1 Tax=Bradyrhizobium TaxID=374 RepID=UPI00157F8D0B|nr:MULTISPECIES: hypothetical protein [Bradyrhizobium]
MSMISLAAMPAVAETRFSDSSFKTILLLCCTGLVASFGLMAYGIDLGAALV